MLTLFGNSSTFCDGLNRRSLLKAGAMGLAGLSLSDVLRLQAASATESAKLTTDTAVIFIELAGGPSQFETYDPKPKAPQEIRGPFQSIPTSQPGERFCELLPQQAKLLDKLTVIRSIHHNKNSHDPSSHLSQTGYYKRGPKGSPNEMPSFGSVISETRGPNHPEMPAYVAVPRVMRNGGSAFLGNKCDCFQTVSDPNSDDYQVQNLSLVKGLDFKRLHDRQGLLQSLDAQRKMLDLKGSSTAVDQFTEQAFQLVSGDQARVAFDIGQESDKVRETYGRNTVGQSMLLARRLVERGVTCVTVRCTGWDDHVNLPKKIVPRASHYDQGVAALINDLWDRGLQRNVMVVAMGEFGRDPRFNKDAGRGHWGPVMSVMMAGGGLQPGILGSSTARGEVPLSVPYRPENVLAMMYRHLGIDPAMTFEDFTGRPRYLLEERELIRELI